MVPCISSGAIWTPISFGAWAKDVEELEDYADAALILSVVGLGAAGADYALSQ